MQSYIIFRARFKQPTFSPGPESLECALFSLDEIPFDSIAFSSVTVALKMVSFKLIRLANKVFDVCSFCDVLEFLSVEEFSSE